MRKKRIQKFILVSCFSLLISLQRTTPAFAKEQDFFTESTQKQTETTISDKMKDTIEKTKQGLETLQTLLNSQNDMLDYEDATIDYTDGKIEILAERKYTFTEEERNLLAKICMAEAGIECLECKMNVICVILNRVADDKFPDTIKDVIYEQGQFEPVSQEKWETLEPNEECFLAVDMVEEGMDLSQGCLFFRVTTPEEDTWHDNHLEQVFKHCHTSFYKRIES